MQSGIREQRGERTPQEIRREHRARRDAMTRAEVEEKSRAICEKLLLTGWYQKCRTIYGYYPLGNEVDCCAFLWRALADGKQVALPRMLRTDLKQMDFYRITAPDQVAEGSFHVMEPLPDCALLREETAVVLVPGVVFDEAGGRYGYGKGCYDRYFARFPGLYRVGAAFEHQMELRLAQNETDVSMNEIHTERRTICAMGAGRAGRRGRMELTEIGRRAKEVSRKTGILDTATKNSVLRAVAEALTAHADQIIAENQRDLARGRENRMPEGLLDRLMLDEARIGQIAEGLNQVADLDDPIGEVLSMKRRPNGLMIGEKRVPLGVVGMIYEARPNVTVDAFGLCFKTGNAVILKGGSDALCSNTAIVAVIQEALAAAGLPREIVQLIEDTRRETTAAFMKLNDYVDVLIPRGGAGLIRTVVEQATIPVIETGTGNCHIFVDESADLTMTVEIIENAKTQRIGVCNACESLILHENIVDRLIPQLTRMLKRHHVEFRADETIFAAAKRAGEPGEGLLVPATVEDWGREYLDYVISAKTVASLDEAIDHINRYNTGHSEAIITNDYTNAQRFLDEVDAACVYVNASTRFSDGFEFGFGAEIGISTQKLHARGPMGLRALTSTKYIIYGNGQIRA